MNIPNNREQQIIQAVMEGAHVLDREGAPLDPDAVTEALLLTRQGSRDALESLEPEFAAYD